MVTFLLHYLAKVHCLLLKPVERLLQGVHAAVQLHLELLLRYGLLDKKQLLLHPKHVATVGRDEVGLMLVHHALDEGVHLPDRLVEQAIEIWDLFILRHVTVLMRVEDLIQVQI